MYIRRDTETYHNFVKDAQDWANNSQGIEDPILFQKGWHIHKVKLLLFSEYELIEELEVIFRKTLKALQEAS